jgi:eukaryotic-like serine/threonine-protein kinase
MDATAREMELTGAELDETIAYVPGSESGLDRPIGSPEMITPTPQSKHRYTYNSGARPLDGYTIKRAIGRGGFGEVYYATSDSGKEVALKLVLHNFDVECRGVKQCMNLKCPNLLTIYDLKTNDAGEAFVIMEYVAGPSLAGVLAQHPHGMPPGEVRAWLKGLVEGVAYLHDHGIVHRDLKPANLFMEEGIVKIGDYGLAKLITLNQGSDHSESIGTCHYMAPEIASGKYHKPIDVYAIGVILYEMITGRVPFEGETVGEVLMKHLTALPDLSMLPEPFRTIVGRALAKDPNHRPARVYDLLPPEDARKEPTVRFIGDGKVRPTSTVPPASPAEKPEDVLRIEAEDPVFYIGPETRPPRRPVIGARLRTGWAAVRRADRDRNLDRNPIRRVSPVGFPASAQVVSPPAPPPALPAARIRVAELATSMLWAGPLAALLSFPAASLLGILPAEEPQQLAYLIVMTLLGTWSVLATDKVFEGRSLDPTTRRMLSLGIGLLLGAASLLFDQVFRHGPPSDAPQRILVGTGLAPWLDSRTLPGVTTESLVYFGGLFLVGGWWKLAGRDRKARFRVWPILVTTLIGALLMPVSPTAQPYGVAVAALVATTTQLVSPWNEAAAAHARAIRNRRWRAA